MTEPGTPTENHDHTRAVIVAITIMVLTCILACTAVLITLILRLA